MYAINLCRIILGARTIVNAAPLQTHIHIQALNTHHHNHAIASANFSKLIVVLVDFSAATVKHNAL